MPRSLGISNIRRSPLQSKHHHFTRGLFRSSRQITSSYCACPSLATSGPSVQDSLTRNCASCVPPYPYLVEGSSSLVGSKCSRPSWTAVTAEGLHESTRENVSLSVYLGQRISAEVLSVQVLIIFQALFSNK